MDLSPDRALVGELSQQLQEAVQARTQLGVALRLSEGRVRELEGAHSASRATNTEIDGAACDTQEDA
jgi:hypothetical protein